MYYDYVAFFHVVARFSRYFEKYTSKSYMYTYAEKHSELSVSSSISKTHSGPEIPFSRAFNEINKRRRTKKSYTGSKIDHSLEITTLYLLTRNIFLTTSVSRQSEKISNIRSQDFLHAFTILFFLQCSRSFFIELSKIRYTFDDLLF